MLISPLPCFLIGPQGSHYLALALAICSPLLLYATSFSFSYYFVAYIKFKNRDNSFNDKAAFEHGVLYSYPTDITKMISRHFKIFKVKGNVFYLKFYLGAKSKKKTSSETIILKITPRRICFDGKKIFDDKLNDMSELEKILSEKAENY